MKSHYLGMACLLIFSAASADFGRLITPDPFPDSSLLDWEERIFAGKTHYTLKQMNGKLVLEAATDGGASVLYKEGNINLTKTPVLEWQWKVNRSYGNINEQSKQGDDFPARIYAVARYGFLPWQSLAINYVWSSSSEKHSDWPNPYTKNSHMIAVQSGNENVGQWVAHKRNIKDDFLRYFGKSITHLDAIAIMVDGDNTGEHAVTLFGNISFSATSVADVTD